MFPGVKMCTFPPVKGADRHAQVSTVMLVFWAGTDRLVSSCLQVRAKHMTLDPAANRYVKYISNIRTIQVSPGNTSGLQTYFLTTST